MSDRPERPPDDDPLAWAPFGRAADDQPPAPLWSGDDPAAADPAPAAPPPGWAAPEAPSSLGWPPAAPAAPAAPPAPAEGATWPPPPPSGGTWPPAGHSAADAGRVPGNAVAALVLGLVGLVVCPFVCSVAAIILGVQARQRIDRTPGLTGRGQATAGIVLGVVGLAFFVIVLATGLGGDLGTTI